MQPSTEDVPINDEQQHEDIPEDIIEETSFIEQPKYNLGSTTNQRLVEPVIDKPPFVPPEKKKGEHKTAYKARVEYFRKLYEGEEVSEYSMRRYGKNSNK